MRKRWILIGLVVGIAVLGEAAIVGIDGTSPYVGEVLFGAMLVSHGSLLAFWAALGGRATPWRLVLAVVGMVTWMRAPEFLSAGENDVTWFFVGLVVLGLVSLTLLIARFLGLELTDIQAADADLPPPPDGRWEQFSLRSLFSWMAALAMILGALHYFPRRQIIVLFSDLDVPLRFAAIVGGSALIALSAVWLTLATRWTAMRYVVAVSVGVVAIVTLNLVFGPSDEAEIVTHCLGQIFYMAGSLWLVRLAGYRLIWRRRVLL